MTKAHDHLPGIPNEPDEDDSSLNDIEASIYRLLGVPGNARSPVEHLAHLKRGELITAFWSIKDCHKVEPIQGPLWPPVDENDQTMVGCPFTVWVPVGAATRALHLWAAGAEGHVVMQSFSRAIEIASSRLLYLGVKLGSKGFPDSGKKEAIDPSQALRLGITAKRTMVEAAENAADQALS